MFALANPLGVAASRMASRLRMNQSTPELSDSVDPSSGGSSSPKIVWLFNVVGAGESLLYWGKILPPFIARFPRSVFYCARPPSKPIPHTDKQIQCAGSIRIPLGKRHQSYDRQMVLPTPWILSRLRSERPDVVIVKELITFAVFLAMCRRWIGKAKILALIEGDPYQGRRKPNRWITWIRRLTCRRIDLIMTNNQGGSDYLQQDLQVPSQKIVVHPFLVSSMQRSDHPAPLPPGTENVEQRIIMLSVGQLIPRKGIREMIEGIRLLQPDILDQMEWWLVGDGPQRTELERLADRFGLTSVIRFLGRQPFEQLPEFFAAADVFVMPTLDDYRALVGFEAISMGLPLLHSIYDGSCGEVVVEGQNGMAFDPHNHQDTADKLRWFIENRDQLSSFGKKSLEISRKFSVQSSVCGLAEAIDICLHGAQTNRSDDQTQASRADTPDIPQID